MAQVSRIPRTSNSNTDPSELVATPIRRKVGSATRSGAIAVPHRVVNEPQRPSVQKPTQAAIVKAPAFRLQSPVRRTKKMKVLVYGQYGSGKTTFAASAGDIEEMNDVILLDAESGDTSLEDRPDLTTVRISNYRQFARVHEFLRLHCRYRDAEDTAKLCELEERFRNAGIEEDDPEYYVVNEDNVKRFNTVIIDTLTEVQKYCMYQLLGVSVGEYALDMEPTSPEWDEWGKSAEMIRLLVRSFRDLPMHVIFVASEAEKEVGKVTLRRPNLPGKLASEVQGFVDAVGYLNVTPGEGEKIIRRLYLRPGRTFQAKIRLPGNTVQYLADPDIKSLSELYNPLRQAAS